MSRVATIVSCNHCERRFVIRMEEVKHEQDGSLVQQFSCPHCDYIYPIARLSLKGQRLRNKIRFLQLAGQSGSDEFEALVEKYNQEVTSLVSSEEDDS